MTPQGEVLQRYKFDGRMGDGGARLFGARLIVSGPENGAGISRCYRRTLSVLRDGTS